MILKNLNVGSIIIDENNRLDKTNNFVIIDHDYYNKNETSIMCLEALKLCFDAKEENNPDISCKYGNCLYSNSNIKTWLNSFNIDWYLSLHEYDAAPVAENVLDKNNEYFNKSGFLSNFSEYFISNLVPVDIITYEKNDYKTLQNQFAYLPSFSELTGNSYKNIVEGKCFNYFSKNKCNNILTRTNNHVDKIINIDNTIFYEKLPVDNTSNVIPILNLNSNINVEHCHDNVYKIKSEKKMNRAMFLRTLSGEEEKKQFDKTVWENNKTLVDAEKLNKIETRIENLQSDMEEEKNKKITETIVNNKKGNIITLVAEDIKCSNNKTIEANLENKVDKVNDKNLSTNDFTNEYKDKLDSIEKNANKYVHPDTHEASIIKQDENNRFVTDKEKSLWNEIIKISEDINKEGQGVNIIKKEEADLNNMYDNGLFVIKKAMNSPSNTNTIHILFVTGLDENTVHFLIVNSDLYLRHKEDKNTWGDWIELANTKEIPTKISQLEKDIKLSCEDILTKEEKDFVSKKEKDLWNTTSEKADKNHKHKFQDIENKPTKLSEFENDKNFVTIKDINTSQNHSHTNKDILDNITEEQIAKWNTGGNTFTKEYQDKLDGIEKNANKYEHPASHSADIIVENENKKFTTSKEKDLWNTVSNKVDKVSGKMLSTNDFTDEYKNKIDNFKTGTTEKYEHPSTHPASMIIETQDKKFITAIEKEKIKDIDNKAIKNHTHSYNDINGKPNIPTKVSELVNDSGFIKSSEYNPSSPDKNSHSHTNKNTLDKISDSDLNLWNTVSNKVDKENGKGLSSHDFNDWYKDKLDSIDHGVKNYVHPSTHPASMIAEDYNRNFVTANEKNAIQGFSSSLSNKVDKISGKNLSTNDFTDAYKNKLENMQNNSYSHPSTHPASMIKVSTSKLKSATVEDALVELFQYADDGKKGIANVIGSPLSASDDFTSIKNKIGNIKHDLGVNLCNKGVMASDSDSLSSLASKIRSISTGKRSAKGETVGSGDRKVFLSVTNLNFKPSTLIIYIDVYISHYNHSIMTYAYTNNIECYDDAQQNIIADYDAYERRYNGAKMSDHMSDKPLTFLDNGFTLGCDGGYLFEAQTTKIRWFAIE